jgi:hypothetical protein
MVLMNINVAIANSVYAFGSNEFMNSNYSFAQSKITLCSTAIGIAL